VAVSVSVGEELGVGVLGVDVGGATSGTAVAVSTGSNVGSGVGVGGGIGLGGVGSAAETICARISELTGGSRAAVVDA
jgi:hypothetical protein